MRDGTPLRSGPHSRVRERVYSSPAAREVELWRVAKDGRELRCLAVYMTTGIDLRLMEGEDFRRTQLLKDGPAVEAKAEEWRGKLGARAGRERDSSRCSRQGGAAGGTRDEVFRVSHCGDIQFNSRCSGR